MHDKAYRIACLASPSSEYLWNTLNYWSLISNWVFHKYSVDGDAKQSIVITTVLKRPVIYQVNVVELNIVNYRRRPYNYCVLYFYVLVYWCAGN